LHSRAKSTPATRRRIVEQVVSPGHGRTAGLLDEIRGEFPRFRVIDKSKSRFHRAIHKALVVITFGQMRDYLSSYQTTIGYTLYVTPDWDERSDATRYETLRHERIHLRQFRRFTFPGMVLLYLLLPLPLGLAYFRARFEWAAYAESIRAAHEVHGREYVAEGFYREYIIRQFTGPSYGWMWPFRRQLDRWYDEVLAELPL